MRFEKVEAGWQLVAANGLVLASLRTEVAVLALRAFCERYVADPQRLPEHFSIENRGQRFAVTPLSGAGDKLAFVVSGGGVSITVATEFVLSAEH